MESNQGTSASKAECKLSLHFSRGITKVSKIGQGASAIIRFFEFAPV
jgi:hypothetical protein